MPRPTLRCTTLRSTVYHSEKRNESLKRERRQEKCRNKGAWTVRIYVRVPRRECVQCATCESRVRNRVESVGSCISGRSVT